MPMKIIQVTKLCGNSDIYVIRRGKVPYWNKMLGDGDFVDKDNP